VDSNHQQPGYPSRPKSYLTPQANDGEGFRIQKLSLLTPKAAIALIAKKITEYARIDSTHTIFKQCKLDSLNLYYIDFSGNYHCESLLGCLVRHYKDIFDVSDTHAREILKVCLLQVGYHMRYSKCLYYRMFPSTTWLFQNYRVRFVVHSWVTWVALPNLVCVATI
jgi:hypothetical protein